jgi:hypothetical protein
MSRRDLMGRGATASPSGQMSPGIRLTADASSLISPRRAAGRTGLGSQACRKAGSAFYAGEEPKENPAKAGFSTSNR